MRKILSVLLYLSIEMCFVIPFVIGTASAQITCNTSGNVVLYSNYDGGVLNINVDVNIPNLKIGIVSYEMVTINFTGPFVNNISAVQFAGYTTTTHHHCANSPAVTSIIGAPPGTDTLIFMPASPVVNSNGYYIVICNYSCDTSSNQGGCNTPDQIAAYFQQEFGGVLRYHFTQYGCWNGTYNISDGGNCCIGALSPPPNALFSAPNHICPGTCTNFTNLSSNATSYQWNFSGATPSTSTDVNPTGICYNTPGTYDVSLIASGNVGSDTITLNNYITVYPLPPTQGIVQSGDTLFSNTGFTTYQWLLNGNIISGATDYFYVAISNGDYNLFCTDANGCEVESVIFDVTTEIESVVGNLPFAIFPNPVRNHLTIYKSLPASIGITRKTAVEISIYNAMGERIYFESENNLRTIDCSLLSQGVYWIEIKSNEKIFRTKFVKAAYQ